MYTLMMLKMGWMFENVRELYGRIFLFDGFMRFFLWYVDKNKDRLYLWMNFMSVLYEILNKYDEIYINSNN